MSNSVTKRRYCRQKITRMYNAVSRGFDDLSEETKLEYYEKMREMKEELKHLDDSVHCESEKECSDSDILNDIVEEEEYEKKISFVLVKLKPPPLAPRDFASMPIPTNKLKLPTITLPQFSNGRGENLEKFLYSFESIVDKHPLSSYEKFVYLKGQLVKAPLLLVESLDTNDQTYDKAVELLTKAFASPLSQKYECIKRLSQLHLSEGAEPYSYIGEMRSIVSSIRSLKIDIDTIMQYFIWIGLNDSFQSQLVQITNNTKPSLEDIENNIFDATDRYLKLKERQNSAAAMNSNMETTSLPTNVRTKVNVRCNLCNADNSNDKHSMRDCRSYPSPEEKVNKLRTLNHCTKCSFRNHRTAECKFKFSSRCRFCQKEHMSFLCLQSGPSRSNNEPDRNNYGRTDRTHNKMLWVQMTNVGCTDDNIILPSFTTSISHNQRNRCVRVLKDSGSQRHFIDVKTATELDLKIVTNINLVVNGFNTSKTLTTTLVEVPLIINDMRVVIKAVVVPNLDICLDIDRLPSIVGEFRKRGYHLADQWLNNSDTKITNFSLILGADAEGILNTKTIKVRENCRAAYLQSPMGVMLTGDSRELYSSLQSLRRCDIGENSTSRVTNAGQLLTNKNVTAGSTVMTVNACSTPNSYDTFCTNDSAYNIINAKNEIDTTELDRATKDTLDATTASLLRYDNMQEELDSEINNKIVDYVISSSDRTPEGRLIMSLPWNPAVKHQLGKNFNLSKQILFSNLKKLKSNNILQLYDNVFKEQERLGIIERITNVTAFMNDNPDCSFLPHMAVHRPDKDTTKVRAVFLSNLCEKSSGRLRNVSHNQALLPGPCLNPKLATAILHSRFDKLFLSFDICKAFLGIALREADQNRLMFLWFKCIENDNYTIIAYRNKRLSFGLRPSPSILMMALYKMLMLDTDNDSQEVINLKKLIYHIIYMDNGGISSDDPVYLNWAVEQLISIFRDYQFDLQQFATNDNALQAKLDGALSTKTADEIKFFGMLWNRVSDSLSPCPINLNEQAKSKRQVLSSVNAVYDIFNMYCPILNRAKIFLHKLQSSKSLDWDSSLPSDLQKEWYNIAKQANTTPTIGINRSVGARTGAYDLVAYSDSSGAIYGVVIYIVDLATKKTTFVTAKNRIINSHLSKKSIPVLELQGIAFATEVLMDIYNEMCGPDIVIPIKIEKLKIFTDSMVCLAWIRSYFADHDKMQKKSVFVLNRLAAIGEQCAKHAITYHYVEGRENPADYVTRCVSYKKLVQTCFYTGPKYLANDFHQPDLQVTVPFENSSCNADSFSLRVTDTIIIEPLIDITKYSSFNKMVNIISNVLKVGHKCNSKENKGETEANVKQQAFIRLITEEQRKYFPDVFRYFENRKIAVTNTPSLILQMNLFVDKDNIIRVKGKLKQNFPILLPSKSHLMEAIVRDEHQDLNHAGLYIVVKEIRKLFWILRGFSTIRSVLKQCIVCKKLNGRPVKVNQNEYRDFRSNPPTVPFSNIMLDYMGPFSSKIQGETQKVYILIVTCMWSRAINMRMCLSANTEEFLRALQLHIFEYGLFKLCLSDLGSQIVAGSKIITNFLDDCETKDFFMQNGIEKVAFVQYAKGNSSLGSLVENCVKQTKHLITKAVRGNILNIRDFEFLIAKTNHIINRRPISFKESLREYDPNEVSPDAITPEQLIHGRELVSCNIIPRLHNSSPENDPEFDPTNDPVDEINRNFEKLKQANARLIEIYHNEFITQLVAQSVNKKDRYQRVPHQSLAKGDIVLLVEENTKQCNYPLGIVERVVTNSAGEVTAAHVFKGKTRETVYRHSTSLIYLLSHEVEGEDTTSDETTKSESPETRKSETIRMRRAAAEQASRKIRSYIEEGSV